MLLLGVPSSPPEAQQGAVARLAIRAGGARGLLEEGGGRPLRGAALHPAPGQAVSSADHHAGGCVGGVVGALWRPGGVVLQRRRGAAHVGLLARKGQHVLAARGALAIRHGGSQAEVRRIRRWRLLCRGRSRAACALRRQRLRCGGGSGCAAEAAAAALRLCLNCLLGACKSGEGSVFVVLLGREQGLLF